MSINSAARHAGHGRDVRQRSARQSSPQKRPRRRFEYLRARVHDLLESSPHRSLPISVACCSGRQASSAVSGAWPVPAPVAPRGFGWLPPYVKTHLREREAQRYLGRGGWPMGLGGESARIGRAPCLGKSVVSRDMICFSAAMRSRRGASRGSAMGASAIIVGANLSEVVWRD
jgi:hypothetical protein